MQLDMLSFALDYAKKGFAVFPLKADKSPCIANGFQKATTDEAQIETWWHTFKNANIGIATGKMSNGICVLDLDLDEEKGKNGIKALRDWQDAHGVIKPTVCAETGRGGWHIYFRADEEIRCRIGLLPGVDVRGDGGYVVAPPSLHANGKRYKWKDNLSPDEMPIMNIDDNIRYLLHHDSRQQSLAYISPDRIPEGERNGTIFKFACMMQAKGASDQTIYAATMAENAAKCNPPLTDKEVQGIVASALKYAKGKPIYIDAKGEATQGQREPIFKTNEKGKIQKTWDNIREAIEFDCNLYGHIRYNELACSIFVYGELPWEKQNTYRPWANADDASLKAYLEKKYGFNNSEKIMDALTIVAYGNKFNPVVDELEQIYRDYGKRPGAIRKLLPTYLGANDTEYTYEVMKLYMLGAITRVFHPGCKFDYTLIIYGSQGAGKSEFFRHLALYPEWFNDNFNTFEGDKAAEKLSGMWMVELAELKALKSAKDSETIKAFLTSRYDTYRAPYSRRSEQRPRMCVFAGTTNNKNVFVDKTGNRRFLPVETYSSKKVKDILDADQDAVMDDFKSAWAEAMDMFYEADKSPILVLPKEMQRAAMDMQEEFSEEDYRVGVIQNWLDETDATRVCVPMLIEFALNMELHKVPKQQKREIQEIMDNEINGWSRMQTKDKGRTKFRNYGNQITFIRDFE